MSEAMDELGDSTNGKVLQPNSINCPSWRSYPPDIRTVRVSNISLAAAERDVFEFFFLCGDIQCIQMQRESETSQSAYVTFVDSLGADTAMLLTEGMIGDQCVSVTPVENYQLPPNAPPLKSFKEQRSSKNGSQAGNKAEDVVSTMLAKGFVLGKDALNKAIEFDRKHQLLQNASATVASIDRKIRLSEKINKGTSLVNGKVKEMDGRFQVSGKTKSAFAAAEQKASTAGSTALGNRYVSTGASWVTKGFGAVSKAAEGVGSMTKEKVEKAAEKRLVKVRPRMSIKEFTSDVHVDGSSSISIGSPVKNMF